MTYVGMAAAFLLAVAIAMVMPDPPGFQWEMFIFGLLLVSSLMTLGGLIGMAASK